MFNRTYPGPIGPVPPRNTHMSVTGFSTSQGVMPHNPMVPSTPGKMFYYGLKPLTGGVVGYIASSILYPDGLVPLFGNVIGRNTFVAGAVAIGLILTELARDYLWSHVPRGISQIGTAATDIGIVAAVDYLAHILIDPNMVAELSKTKVLMEATGVVLVSDYVYNHFLLPWAGYKVAEV